jgi:glycosyltransferase involved in cell wall biosynthesis
MQVVTCNTAYGAGGLGSHFKELVEEARTKEQLERYYGLGIRPGDPQGTVVTAPNVERLRRFTPLRYSPSWNNHLANEEFDQKVAALLSKVQHFVGFGGCSLGCFKKVRAAGWLELQAANSHVTNVLSQHRKSIARFGIESTWLNEAQVHKTKQEYAMADQIVVASEYGRQSFLREGISAEKLALRSLTPHPRFQPGARPKDGIFRIVYLGSLTVMKGVPVLLEAFSRFPNPNSELTLVGGWATRGMKRYLKNWQARDSRLKICPGDPLSHLQRADVCVHPTYEDGFAYAPMEALACGTPVIVTEDTGMKEFVVEGINGYVVPTGDHEAILERLLATYAKPLMQMG